MSELIDYLIRYPFVRYAVIAVVLVSLCSSLLGVTLVLKRFSYIGDGLSHVAFGVIALSAVFNTSGNMFFVMPVTVICAILLLKGGRRSMVRGDAAIAMVSVSALAIGYLLMNKFSTPANLSGDVCSTLFGSTLIITMSKADVTLCAVASALVVAFFVFFYNKIFAVTFDEDFSEACGTKAEVYNLVFASVIAIIVVIAMNLVGSLLISALVVFPALSAMRVFKNFKAVTVCAAVAGVVCALAGTTVSILAGTPVGATVVAANIVCFLLFTIAGKIRG